ncbi:hypothetical protein D3C87_1821370 [compost metagenome]
MHQLFTIKHRQALAGVKHKRDTCIVAFLGVLEHGISAIWRNNRQRNVTRIIHAVGVGILHGARVKGRDLVIIHIRGDKCLRRISAGNRLDVLWIDIVLLQPALIR